MKTIKFENKITFENIERYKISSNEPTFFDLSGTVVFHSALIGLLLNQVNNLKKHNNFMGLSLSQELYIHLKRNDILNFFIC